MRRVCAAHVLLGIVLCWGAQAQPATVEIPDFAPDPYVNWRSDRDDNDNYLPPLSGPGPVISHPDYPYRPNAPGDDAAGDPTNRVADLTSPILTPWSIEKMTYWNDLTISGEAIPFKAEERCYPPGPAWNVFHAVQSQQIFFAQQSGRVWTMWRGDNQVRRIYLNVPHSENPNPTWHGESVGHYEGNTLVVDTVAFLEHPLSFVDNYRTPHSGQLHVIERLTLVDPDTLYIDIYFEDPIAFTTPWRARQILYRSTSGPIRETVCGEAGLSLTASYFGLHAVPIPTADIPDF